MYCVTNERIKRINYQTTATTTTATTTTTTTLIKLRNTAGDNTQHNSISDCRLITNDRSTSINPNTDRCDYKYV